MYLARVSSHTVVLYLGPINICNSGSIMQAQLTFVPSYGMLLQHWNYLKIIYFSPEIHLDPLFSRPLQRKHMKFLNHAGLVEN